MIDFALAVVVSSGSSVSSGYAAIGRGTLVGVWCPVVDSGDLFLRASYDVTSADFVRVQKPVTLSGSGDLRFGSGVGSSFIPTAFLGNVAPYLKVETATTQTDNRTFQLCIVGVR